MLEKKSLQQFKEEWLQKFPVTYKVQVLFMHESSDILLTVYVHVLQSKLTLVYHFFIDWSDVLAFRTKC